MLEHSDMALDLRGVRLKLAHPDSALERQSSCRCFQKNQHTAVRIASGITIDPKMTNAVA